MSVTCKLLSATVEKRIFGSMKRELSFAVLAIGVAVLAIGVAVLAIGVAVLAIGVSLEREPAFLPV